MRREIKLLLLTNAFFVFAINLFAPLFAIYIQRIDVSIVHIGAIYSVYIFAVGAFALLINKMKKIREYAVLFLILGFVLRLVGWIGYLFVTQIWQIYVLQLIFALGEAFGTPAYNFIYSRFIDQRKFGNEWSVNTATVAFIVGLASLVGVVIVEKLGFHALFALMIALSLVSIAFAIKHWKSLVQ